MNAEPSRPIRPPKTEGLDTSAQLAAPSCVNTNNTTPAETANNVFAAGAANGSSGSDSSDDDQQGPRIVRKPRKAGPRFDDNVEVIPEPGVSVSVNAPAVPALPPRSREAPVPRAQFVFNVANSQPQPPAAPAQQQQEEEEEQEEAEEDQEEPQSSSDEEEGEFNAENYGDEEDEEYGEDEQDEEEQEEDEERENIELTKRDPHHFRIAERSRPRLDAKPIRGVLKKPGEKDANRMAEVLRRREQRIAKSHAAPKVSVPHVCPLSPEATYLNTANLTFCRSLFL